MNLTTVRVSTYSLIFYSLLVTSISGKSLLPFSPIGIMINFSILRRYGSMSSAPGRPLASRPWFTAWCGRLLLARKLHQAPKSWTAWWSPVLCPRGLWYYAFLQNRLAEALKIVYSTEFALIRIFYVVLKRTRFRVIIPTLLEQSFAHCFSDLTRLC